MCARSFGNRCVNFFFVAYTDRKLTERHENFQVQLRAMGRGEKTVAASRIMHPDTGDPGAAGGPLLERLQYRLAQSGQNPAGRNAWTGADRDPLAFSVSTNSVVPLFPVEADDAYGAPQAVEIPEPVQESGAELRQAVAELERRLEEEKTAALHAIAAAREQGRREERQLLEEARATDQQQLQTQALRNLKEFQLERQRYFHHVEGEVVRLSLSIAARVLHREAQLDPALLAGAVRVALDKLADSSTVVMRVPPAEVTKWREFFRAAGGPRIQPGIIDDPSLAPGECLLVTELGTIELGVRAQLEEIEKGFFDLLDRRPSGVSAAPANGTNRSI